MKFYKMKVLKFKISFYFFHLARLHFETFIAFLPLVFLLQIKKFFKFIQVNNLTILFLFHIYFYKIILFTFIKINYCF